MKIQHGSVMIISLSIMTLAMVSVTMGLNMLNLENKIINNFYHKKVVFRIAELGLKDAKSLIKNSTVLQFDASCLSGLCFNGMYPENIGLCSSTYEKVWLDSSIWKSSSFHRSLKKKINGIDYKARYIIEFLCYLPKDKSGLYVDPRNINHWSKLYRITSLGSVANDSLRVMLQINFVQPIKK